MEGFIASISSRLVREKVMSADDVDIFAYGLDLLLFTGLTNAAFLAFGVIVGRLSQTLIYIFTFSVLQALGGGFHASTHLRCFLVTTACWVTAMLLACYFPVVAHVFLLIIGVCAVFLFAPIENQNAPMSDKKKRKMRRYSRFACLGLAAISISGFFGVTYVFFSIADGIFLSSVLKIVAQIQNHRHKRKERH